MCVDLSKFLHFSSPERVNLDRVLEMPAVEEYVQEPQRRQVGPSEIVAKLNVILFAQTFMINR